MGQSWYHQRMCFLWQLKKFNLPKTMKVHLYTAITETIIIPSITIWYAAATAKDKGRLQHICSAKKVTGCSLPSLQDLYTSRTLNHAGKIVVHPSHHGHKLFESLLSGRRLRSIKTKTCSWPHQQGSGPPLTPTVFLSSTSTCYINVRSTHLT